MSAYDSQLCLSGEGRAVVLVPGMNGTDDLVYCQVPRLQRSFRVATYRLRDDAENLDALAEHLARVVQAAFDVRDRLQEIRSPTLFLALERDHLVPAVAQARYMANRVRSSVMRILEEHGHRCLIAPDLDLADIIRQWP